MSDPQNAEVDELKRAARQAINESTCADRLAAAAATHADELAVKDVSIAAKDLLIANLASQLVNVTAAAQQAAATEQAARSGPKIVDGSLPRTWSNDAMFATLAGHLLGDDGPVVLGGFSKSDNSLVYQDDNMLITNLDPLENVTFIGGNVDLTNCPRLRDIRGLANVTGIAGRLTLGGPLALESIALTSLINIGGDLTMTGETPANSTSGLESLITVGRDLSIASRDPGLESVDGLSGITTVGRHINIGNNQRLADINGLNGITSAYSVTLASALTGLTGGPIFRGLVNVTDYISIGRGLNLDWPNIFPALECVGGSLRGEAGDQLTPLSRWQTSACCPGPWSWC